MTGATIGGTIRVTGRFGLYYADVGVADAFGPVSRTISAGWVPSRGDGSQLTHTDLVSMHSTGGSTGGFGDIDTLQIDFGDDNSPLGYGELNLDAQCRGPATLNSTRSDGTGYTFQSVCTLAISPGPDQWQGDVLSCPNVFDITR
jgi:hypothetical protein